MDENKDYSKELNRVIDYVKEILINEFPNNLISIPYITLSILDNKNCHANLMLDNCMMSDSIHELRSIYEDLVKSNMNIQANKDDAKFDGNVERLLDLSRNEMDRTNGKEVGTEHVLLALINDANGFTEHNIFRKFGVEYNFLLEKCKNSIDTNVYKERKLKKPSLKSQVNMKHSAVSVNVEEIKKYTTNISEEVRNGTIDEIIGRDAEISEIIKILSRRNKNNVILVGGGGCGKTSIVYKLASMIENGDVPTVLEGKEVIMLNAMELVAGTTLRGMFEERVTSLFNEISATDKYILFIDDMQNVLRSVSKEKDSDLSSMLPSILNNRNVKVICAINYKDYKNTVESNNTISRKLQKIVIEPSTKEDSINILMKVKDSYEKFHNVTYSEETIAKAVELSARYITDRALPDSAIDVIDIAGASASITYNHDEVVKELKKRLNEIDRMKQDAMNNGDFEQVDDLVKEETMINVDLSEHKRQLAKADNKIVSITEDDIAKTISELTKIPVNRLSIDEKKQIATMDETIKKSVVGQDEAVESICKVIKRNKVGLSNENKNIGTFLLVGPSGVGKSLIAKKLAEQIFGDEKALVRIDMSEYSEKSSISKLIGTSAGYIGYENGGLLTEAVKHKQYCVLLLDEIEKANQEIHNLFLQLFDEGRLTDGSGQLINFKNVVIIMTSNVGARQASELGSGVGFVKKENEYKKSIIDKELKNKFTPEFLNRIDKIVYFNNLSNENLKDIVKLELNKFKTRLNKINYNIIYNDNIIDYVHEKAISEKEFGARPITRIVQNVIEDKVTELMLSKEYEKNYTFSASCQNNYVSIV